MNRFCRGCISFEGLSPAPGGRAEDISSCTSRPLGWPRSCWPQGPLTSPALIHQTQNEVTNCCLRANYFACVQGGRKGLSPGGAPPPQEPFCGDSMQGA